LSNVRRRDKDSVAVCPGWYQIRAFGQVQKRRLSRDGLSAGSKSFMKYLEACSGRGVSAGSIRAMAARGKGRGVFAVAAIACGEVVEQSCTIELGAQDCDYIQSTPIEDYYFAHPEDDNRGLMVLGLASLCNHSDTPNVDTTFVRDDDLGWIVLLTANKAIAAGAEITRRYACPPWFQIAS